MEGDFLRHQVDGSDWLAARQFGCLWDEPGAGKTATLIRACDQAQASRVLVLSPAAVKSNWAKEFDRWGRKRDIDVIDGYPKEVPRAGVSIASHASLVDADALRHVMTQPWHAVIVDEAHEFRTDTARRTMALYGDATLDPTREILAHGLQYRSHFLWPATGTPIVNSASDLYPVIRARLRNGIGAATSWWDYCQRFTKLVPDAWGGQKPVGVENPAELRQILNGSVLRRTLSGVGITLPDLMLVPTQLDVPPSALIEVMAQLEAWTPERLELALETQDELRDSAISRTRHAVGLAKVPMLASHMASLLQRGIGPLVCFYYHTDVMEKLRAHPLLADLAVGVIQGGLGRRKLKQMEDCFQSGMFHMLFVQIQAGGTGLTLTRSFHGVVAEMPWTATALMQAVKRLHRYTQRFPVTVDVAMLGGCWLEDVMLRVVQRKYREEQAFLSALT